MITESIAPFLGADLVELGAQARAVRERIFPHAIVTYSLEPDDFSGRAMLSEDHNVVEFVQQLKPGTKAITPACGPGLTAVDYLRLVAVCRLVYPHLHIQVDTATTGLKVGQLALAFGADDFGLLNKKPSNPASEEEARQKIKEAGFIPKRRNGRYSYYWLD